MLRSNFLLGSVGTNPWQCSVSHGVYWILQSPSMQLSIAYQNLDKVQDSCKLVSNNQSFPPLKKSIQAQNVWEKIYQNFSVCWIQGKCALSLSLNQSFGLTYKMWHVKSQWHSNLKEGLTLWWVSRVKAHSESLQVRAASLIHMMRSSTCLPPDFTAVYVPGSEGQSGGWTVVGIRLVGGFTYGRVEVYRNGVWGTVCDDGWSSTDGRVVCRELGFMSVRRACSSACYGSGSGRIWMDDVACTGSERMLLSCTHTSLHNCAHSEDAGVSCSKLSLDVGSVNCRYLRIGQTLYVYPHSLPVCFA